MTRKVLLCSAAGVLAVALACSKTNTNPASPSTTTQPDTGAAADGSTLKVAAPTITSPTGGAQVNDPTTLVFGSVNGKYASFVPTYRVEVRSGTTVVASGTATGTSFAPTGLESDTNYTWRVRAEFQGAFGPWSSDASFRSPIGAFIRGNEIRDPLTIGRTVGVGVGPVQFVANGLRLGSQESRITYQLPTTLEAGEFSLLVMGIDEGNPGDKTKVMSMQEGFGDITTNDYRVTIEKRGAQYTTPGAITFRMINGEGDDEHYIKDGCRSGTNCPFSSLSDERWYFFKFTWNSTSGRLEVREDSETGRIIYASSVTTNGHAYRPVPHVIHLGSPVGRAGPIDASIAGATYKNVYVGPGPRPIFR